MKDIRTNSTFAIRTVAVLTLATMVAISLLPEPAAAVETKRQVMVRDITTVQGVRDNLLVGYGLVVGLTNSGDTQQTIFTVQTLANAMQKMGVLITPGSAVVKNVAAVFITATLPPFARPGVKLDVTVSSVGDAKSLVGGVLLMSALHGPDGQVYAEAQGPLVMGGYSAGNGANGKQVNATTVGVIPNGGIVERDTTVDISGFKVVSLLLRNPDFTTATDIASAVNIEFGRPIASALDSSRVDVNVADASAKSVPLLIARIQNLKVKVSTPAKIIVNERTGTIVLGGDVTLSPVSVIHGSLSIQVTTRYDVSQPLAPSIGSRSNEGGTREAGSRGAGAGGGAGGQTVVVPETNVEVTDAPAQSMRLDEGANVEELVSGLHAIGTTARDVVAILQAIKAEGGMQADLEVQ
jgi:flagellar P-ring protein precursor FlgI